MAFRSIVVLGTLLATLGFTPAARSQSVRVSDSDIVEAYHYMLGRWLVLRQEAVDLEAGLKWNEITHRSPPAVDAANPDRDLVRSEAWIFVNETSCTVLELPEIKDRYYTAQVTNGWAEVTVNINERKFPKHPFGKFALCLKAAKVKLPADAQRIDLPNRKSRLVVRLEVGASPVDAQALQKQITLKPTGSPKVDRAVIQPDFTNDKLPGAEGFDDTEEILASEADVNKGMAATLRKVRAVAKAAADPRQRRQVDGVIRKQAIPAFYAAVRKVGPMRNGWIHPRTVGNYGNDYLGRALVSFIDIWANSSTEAVYFDQLDLDGGHTYTLTFPEGALPRQKAQYFWSVIAVDGEHFRLIPNSIDRYLLSNQSILKLNANGSLTLVFAPRLPESFSKSNWLPTPEGKKYKLTLRLYGPPKDVSSGKYYPPALVKKK